MNIFQKIGNRLEEDKKNKELFEKRYWNLTPIERIDYDNKRDRIEKSFYGFFPLTLVCLKYLVISSLLFISTFYLIGSIELSNLFMNITLILFKTLSIGVLVDFICLIVSNNDVLNRIKNLNKRFKLDTRHI